MGEMGQAKMIKKVFEEIKRMHEVMGKAGAWNSSDYSCGFFNGLEFCYAVLNRRAPYFKERPGEIVERDLRVMRNVDLYDLGKLSASELAESMLNLYKNRTKQ